MRTDHCMSGRVNYFMYFFLTTEKIIHFLFFFANFFKGFFKEKWLLFFKIRTHLPPFLLDDSKEYIWFHVSSAGELEQSIPIMENFCKLGYRLLISYFSPSTEPFLKKVPPQSLTFPLPLFDSNCLSKILRNIKIKHAVFVKYEVWPSMIVFCKRYRIPFSFAFVKKTDSKNDFFKKILKSMWDFKIYNLAEHIFCIGKEDVEFFENNIDANNIVLSGDAKWERARFHAQTALNKIHLDKYLINAKKCSDEMRKNQKKVLIFGSPHNEEYSVFKSLVKLKNSFVIIAPHEVTEKHIKELIDYLNNQRIYYSLLSEIDNQNNCFLNEKPYVLIVNKMGFLASLYSIADAAVIGGGFDGQIHNVLEPAAHGVPTFFGSKHSKAPEATELIKKGCAIEFKTPESLEFFLHALTENKHEDELTSMRMKAKMTFSNLPESSKIICQSILSLDILTGVH